MEEQAQTTLFDDDGAYDHERVKEYEIGLTPEAVVRQWLVQLRDHEGMDPRTMLDPSAGDGVFGKIAREVWPNVHLVAVELREECWKYLEANYDVILRGTLEQYTMGLGTFDLIVTNPPFSLALPWVPMLRKHLVDDGLLSFLHLSDLGQRGEKNGKLFKADLPVLQSRIPGAIGFRGPGINPETGKRFGTDMRSYSWWLWEKLGLRRAWLSNQLPRLLGPELKWVTPPGRAA